MTTYQLLWVLNSILVAALAFFIKRWIEKSEASIKLKLDSVVCTERHNRLEHKCSTLFKHKHAPTGNNNTGGEVIIP